MLEKIITFIKSWKYIDLKKSHKIIVFGPEAKEYLSYFEKNYYWCDPLKENIFNIRLLLPGLKYFLILFIKKPIKLFKFVKLWPTIFTLVALIKINKIKNLISLVDYNPWPKIFKNLLENEVYTIGMQGSSRAYPLDNVELAKSFDEYFLWNEFNDNELKLIKKTKLTKFGALKSYIVVNETNSWEKIKKLPDKIDSRKELVLISSYTFIHENFFNKFLKDLNKHEYEKILVDLENKSLKEENFGKIEDKLLQKENFNLIKEKNDYYQCIEFFKVCIYLKKIIDSHKINFCIIERNKIGSEPYKNEKKVFKQIFDNDYLTNLDMYKRINFITNRKDSIFVTNASTLGRECLALNRKVFFPSFLLHYYNPKFFDKLSPFFSLNDNYESFYQKINALINMDKKAFINNIKNIKNTVPSCYVSKNRFNYFLEKTGFKTKIN